MFGLPTYKCLGKYYLIELGKKTVHDNRILVRENRKKFWFEKFIFSFIAPIIVAVV